MKAIPMKPKGLEANCFCASCGWVGSTRVLKKLHKPIECPLCHSDLEIPKHKPKRRSKKPRGT